MFQNFSRVRLIADDFCRSYINSREERLAAQDLLQVCSFNWGTEALEGIAGFESQPGSSQLEALRKANHLWRQNNAVFFAHHTPTDFQLHGPNLQFPSAVKSFYPENDTVHALYSRCKRAHRRAVLVLPHWTATPTSYSPFCRILNALGFSSLLVTLPYHGNRKPKECTGAEYSVSPNIGRTIAAARQGVIDTLSCLNWLTKQGYEQIAIFGNSLGFGHGFLASALDRRLQVNVFNHCCSTVSDAVWDGMPKYRAALERHISQRELRECWSVINPISYVGQYARLPKRSLLVLGRYDTIFPRDYVEELIRHFDMQRLDHRKVELACGHRTIGDAPYLLLSAYHICAFLRKNLRHLSEPRL